MLLEASNLILRLVKSKKSIGILAKWLFLSSSNLVLSSASVRSPVIEKERFMHSRFAEIGPPSSRISKMYSVSRLAQYAVVFWL